MQSQSLFESLATYSNFEFEDEWAQENESPLNSEFEEEGSYFFKKIAKAANSIAKNAKPLIPSVVQSLLSLIPESTTPDASAGKLSYAMLQEGEMEVAQRQAEFFGDNELEAEVSNSEAAHEAALTEFFADQAAEATSESEAEFMIGATLPITTSIMGAKRGLRSVMPAMAQASAQRSRILTKQGASGQQLLRAIPMIDRLAIAALKAAARAGEPINSATAVKAMAAATDRVLNNPQLLQKAIAQNLAVRQKTAPSVAQSAHSCQCQQESDRNLEAEAEYSPNSTINRICVQAGTIAERLRQDMQSARSNSDPRHRRNAIESIQKRGIRWINSRSNEIYSYLDKLHSRDLDRLNGCLNRVASTIGKDPLPLQRLRKAIESRLGMSVR